ncbi:MAG: helix-turn-helix domain-containing protein [Prevotellaceae bacterium]|jgi:excisionase family DNA binding protein|nr:helix-turn-helix domain-containing protein [Prevotellaceae bacterium]
MTTIFEYNKVCQFCGKAFIAQKSTTKHCSDTCAKRAYKAEQKAKRQKTDVEAIKERNRQKLLSQEFLSISETAELLSTSRPTIYKMIASGKLNAIRISERVVRIKRSDLEKIQVAIIPINTPIAEINKAKEEFISVAETLKKYNISNSWFYQKVKKADIQHTYIDGRKLYSRKEIHKLFAKKEYTEYAEWYSVAEIMEKFGVSQQYIYEYTSDHKMPKKREGKNVLISKHHWDKSRNIGKEESENYYTVPQATEKFLIGRSHLYDLIRAWKIPKIKRGNYILIHRETLDNIMNNRKLQ